MLLLLLIQLPPDTFALPPSTGKGASHEMTIIKVPYFPAPKSLKEKKNFFKSTEVKFYVKVILEKVKPEKKGKIEVTFAAVKTSRKQK